MSTESPQRADRARTTHLVIPVHGINTFGDWQNRLKGLLAGRTAAGPDEQLEVIPWKYGVFSVAWFLIPFARWRVRRKFRLWLLDRLKNRPGLKRVDFVAHSFGTDIVGHTLRDLYGKPGGRAPDGPELPQVGTVILASSVLDEEFRWEDMLDGGRVGRVVNECGVRDKVLILSQLFVIGTGMGGKVGFYGGQGDHFLNRYYGLRHDDWFRDPATGRRSDAFMRERWVPLLGEPPETPLQNRADGEGDPQARPDLPGWWVKFLRYARLGTPLLYAFLLVGVPTAVVTHLRDQRAIAEKAAEFEATKGKLEAEKREAAHRLIRLAELLEAGKLVGRHPGFVYKFLLGRDAANGESPKDIAAALESQAVLRLAHPDFQPDGLVALRLARLARPGGPLPERPTACHALGVVNYWLAADSDPAGKDEQLRASVGALKKALAGYAAAGRWRCEALCRLDLARAHVERQEYRPALRELKRADEASFPRFTTPAWLALELHRERAKVLWRYFPSEYPLSDVVEALDNALVQIEDNPGWFLDIDIVRLKAEIILELGWAHMHHRARDAAASHFEWARDTARSLAKLTREEDGRALVIDTHAAHGTVMAEYFIRAETDAGGSASHAAARRAAEEYGRIVERIRAALRERESLGYRERAMLRGRLVNTLTRRADAMLLSLRGLSTQGDRQAARDAAAYYQEAEAESGKLPGPATVLRSARLDAKGGLAAAISGGLGGPAFGDPAGRGDTPGSYEREVAGVYRELAGRIAALGAAPKQSRPVLAADAERRLRDALNIPQHTGREFDREDADFLIWAAKMIGPELGDGDRSAELVFDVSLALGVGEDW